MSAVYENCSHCNGKGRVELAPKYADLYEKMLAVGGQRTVVQWIVELGIGEKITHANVCMRMQRLEQKGFLRSVKKAGKPGRFYRALNSRRRQPAKQSGTS